MKSLSRMERVPYLPLTPVNVSVTTSPSGSLVHHLLAEDGTIKSSNESS